MYRSNIFISLSILIPIAIIHSLYLSVDSQNYREAFEFYNETSWNLFFRQLKEVELFHLTISKIYPEDQLIYIFSIIVGLSVTLKILLINKASRSFYISVLFYLAYFYILHDGTQIRVSLAIAVSYWGLYLWSQELRKEGFIIILLSGLTLHYSLLAFIVIFIIHHRKLTNTIILSWFLLIVLYLYGYSFIPSIYDLFIELQKIGFDGGKVLSYLKIKDPNSKPYSIQFLFLYFATLITYIDNKEEINNFEASCFNACFFSFLVLVLLSGESVLQNRISEIFRFSIIFIIPLYFKTLEKIVRKKAIAYMIFIFGLGLYYYIYVFKKGLTNLDNLTLILN